MQCATIKLSALTVSLCMAAPAIQAAPELPQDKFAMSFIEYSVTTGTALYKLVAADSKLRIPGDKYQNLARSIAMEIEGGKAASSLAQAPFKLIADSLTLAAVVDPEPTTKVVAAVSAYGAQKLGEVAANAIYNAAETKALGILARALKDSQVTAGQLKNMEPAAFAAMVDDLRLGDNKIRDILKDNPKALEMLKANAEDLARAQGTATLLQAKETAGDVAKIKAQLIDDSKQLQDFREATIKALDEAKAGLSDLGNKADKAAKDLEALKVEVGSNTRSIQSLAQISSMNWSTEQKLAALDSGLFPEMTPAEVTATRRSLESQRSVEQAIDHLNTTSHYLDSVGTIAQNLGVDPNIVAAVRQGQTAVTGITRMVAGDYIGGIATLTGLMGAAAPDPAEERHKQLMAYLDRQFEQLNKTVEEILELQKQTINALQGISTQLVEIKDQLANVERVVVLNRAALQYLLLAPWQPCEAMIGKLNNQYTLPSLDSYIDQITAGYFTKCYSQYREFFDARVKTANWAGGELSQAMLPAKNLTEDPEMEKRFRLLGDQKILDYRSARGFLVTYHTAAAKTPAQYLAALSDPKPNVDAALDRDQRISLNKDKYNAYTCGQDILNRSLGTLLCLGTQPGNPAKPRERQWTTVLNDTLVGPQAMRIIDNGIVLSQLADFLDNENGQYFTVPEADLRAAGIKGPSPKMLKALKKRHGEQLLEQLRWLGEAYVLQQSAAYGDFTASSIVEVLYDPVAKALRDEAPPGDQVQQLALLAMKNNAVLARNVVMLAMRRALTTTVDIGEEDNPRYIKVPQSTLYSLGMANYSGAYACADDPVAKKILQLALPNWKFAVLADATERVPGMPLEKCAGSDPTLDIGSGLVVKFKDFVVKAPSPRAIETGEFEYPASLRLALAYRENISEAQTMRRIGSLISDSPTVTKAEFARALLASKCFTGRCEEGFRPQP